MPTALQIFPPPTEPPGTINWNMVFGPTNEGGPGIGNVVGYLILIYEMVVWFDDLFTGRPKDEATQQVIQGLLTSPNFAAHIAAQELHRLVSDHNIVISDSSPYGQTMLGQVAHHFTTMMEGQGATRTQGFNTWTRVLSRDFQASQKLPPLIAKKVPDGYGLTGSPTMQDEFCAHYLWESANQANQHDATGKSVAWVIRNTSWKNLTGLTIQPNGIYGGLCTLAPQTLPRTRGTCAPGYKYDKAQKLCTFDADAWPNPQVGGGPVPEPLTPPGPQLPGTPTPPTLPGPQPGPGPTIPPGGPQNCPPGFTWSPVAQSCTPSPIGTNCPPGYVYNAQTQTCDPVFPANQYCNDWTTPPPCPPTATAALASGSDTLEAAQQISQYLVQIDGATQQIAFTLQAMEANEQVCCSQFVVALNAIVTQLAACCAHMTAPGPEPPAPVDFSAIVTALEEIAEALPPISTGVVQSGAEITAQLSNLVAAVEKLQGSDVSGIVDQLKNIFTTLDPPAGVYQQLVADGFLDAKYAQLAGAGDLGTGLVSGATWFYNTVNKLLKWATGADFGTYSPASGGEESNAQYLVRTGLAKYISATDDVIAPTIQPLLAAVMSLLIPTGATTIGNIHVDQDKPINVAVGTALSAGVAAFVLSYAGVDAGEPLAHIAELISGAIGWEELRDVQIGPLVKNGIAKIADMSAKAIFRQETGDASSAASLLARGLLDQGTFNTIAAFAGLPNELMAPTQAGAYGGMNPRILMRISDSGLFSNADLADELTFSGMRPASQHRFLLAAAYMATDPQRKALVTQLEAAYQAGLLADSDLTSAIDSADHNTDKSNLILLAAHWKQLIAETKILENEYSILFRGGLIDDPTYRSYLSGIGLQPGFIAIRAGQVEAQANATLHRQELAAAAKLDNQTKQAARTAAKKMFAAGELDQAGLTVALLATGLTPAQVGAWVEIAQLLADGSASWTYGQKLTSAGSKLLRAKVSAISDQRKSGVINDAQMVAQLTALKIPPVWINALRAAADAMITPKTAAVLVPVTT